MAPARDLEPVAPRGGARGRGALPRESRPARRPRTGTPGSASRSPRRARGRLPPAAGAPMPEAQTKGVAATIASADHARPARPAPAREPLQDQHEELRRGDHLQRVAGEEQRALRARRGAERLPQREVRQVEVVADRRARTAAVARAAAPRAATAAPAAARRRTRRRTGSPAPSSRGASAARRRGARRAPPASSSVSMTWPWTITSAIRPRKASRYRALSCGGCCAAPPAPPRSLRPSESGCARRSWLMLYCAASRRSVADRRTGSDGVSS